MWSCFLSTMPKALSAPQWWGVGGKETDLGLVIPGGCLASRTEKGSRTPPCVVQTLITQTLSQANPTAITAEEYFNPNFELGNRDMGRPMELTTKTQK